MSYVEELLQAGVRCYAYHNGFLHSKVITADGEIASVGTANLDVRSFSLNFEQSAFLYHREMTAELDAAFEADLAQCSEITLEAASAAASMESGAGSGMPDVLSPFIKGQ